MSFQTLLVRGRRVAEIAEEYETELSSLVPDIRDNLIEAQQAHIEALANMVIDLGRQRRMTHPVGCAATPLDRGEFRRPTLREEYHARVNAAREAWNALLSSLRPGWL